MSRWAKNNGGKKKAKFKLIQVPCFHYRLYFQQKFSSRELGFGVAEAEGFYQGPGGNVTWVEEGRAYASLIGRVFDVR